MDECAPEGFVNLYRRDSSTGLYEALIPPRPSKLLGANYTPELQGISSDNARAVFRANAKLTNNASNALNSYQLYEHIKGEEGCGELRLVSILPDGNASTLQASAGTPAGNAGEPYENALSHAVSADGKRVFWSVSGVNSSGQGPLYLRENADQALESSNCADPAKACTVQVSAAASQFWTAAADGSKAIYTVGKDLYEFDTGKALAGEPASALVAEGTEGVVGASEDLSRLYFVSTNAIGGEGEAGEPNLYLRRVGGAVNLIATLFGGNASLPGGDLQRGFNHSGFAVALETPIANGVRLTPDGEHLAFVSSARLSGYDNKDAVDGRPDLEIYLYDLAADHLACVSCNPSGARPVGRLFEATGGNKELRRVAAQMAPGENQSFAPRAFSADGNRLFFESFEALLARDTNGQGDVYEWERGASQRECEGEGAELFVPGAGGCLSLISTGQSPTDSELADASPDGSNVFIRTASSLLPQDPGQVDLYDVREDGGLPQPPPQPAACEGEACQGPISAPNDPTPASSVFRGAGNVKEGASKRCRRGKVRRKGRCVTGRQETQAREASQLQPEGGTMRKQFLPTLAAACLAALLLASSASAAFGIDDFDVTYNAEDGSGATQAGSHPFAMTTAIDFSFKPNPEIPGGFTSDGSPKDLIFNLPTGLVGDREAVPACSNAQFLVTELGYSTCPDADAVGIFRLRSPGETSGGDPTAVYNLVPPPGVVAKIGFVLYNIPIAILIRVNPAPPYNLIASLQNASDVVVVGGSALTVWGNPASPRHDSERGPCARTTDSCPVILPERPFLTLPRACAGPLLTSYAATSWEEPDATPLTGFSSSALLTNGCGKLAFGPTITAKPTTLAAQSPTGLDFSLDVKDEGLSNPKGLANSDVKKAVVTLPEGFSTNPSLAEGLNVCTKADLARETAFSAPGAGCPDESKIGTVEVESPLLDESVNGSLFIAKPYDNEAGDSLLGLYMVIKNPVLGIVVTQALKVEPDPVTGQLTTVVDNIPQLPFSHFKLHFREGTRSPLASPPGCGEYNATAVLSPWSGSAPITTNSAFSFIVGPESGPCPSGATPPFHPDLQAGTLNNAAGSYSPFYLRLDRKDSEQEITHFSIKLPPGVVGKLAGIPFCSEAAIAAAKARTGPHGGQEELDSPSCPKASEVGRTLVGAGVGHVLGLRPRQGLPRRPLPRLRPLDRGDHRRQGRALRPRHRCRAPGAEGQPRNRRSLRRRHRIGPDPPHHQRHPGPPQGHPRLRRQAKFRLEPDLLQENLDGFHAARLGPQLRHRSRRPAGHGDQPLPGGRLRLLGLHAETGPLGQGRHQARGPSQVQSGPHLPQGPLRQHRRRPGHPAPLGVPRHRTHQNDLHPGPVQRRHGPRGKVPGCLDLRLRQGDHAAARRTDPGPGLPALLLPQPPRRRRRPALGQDRRQPGRADRLGQRRADPQHLRICPRRPGNQVHPGTAGRQEGALGQLDQPLQEDQPGDLPFHGTERQGL